MAVQTVLYWPILSAAMVFLLVIVLSARHSRKQVQQSSNQPSLSTRLMPYVRRLVYFIAILWAIVLAYYAFKLPGNELPLALLMRYYGLSALLMLFVVLTPGLLLVYFPRLRVNALLIHARRSFGLSMFFFVLLHVGIFLTGLPLFLQVAPMLPRSIQLAFAFSTVAFIIFIFMASTSFDRMVKLLGYNRWKWLHRLVYPATILVLFHSFLIGTHYVDRGSRIALVTVFLAATYILLEIGATIKMLNKNKSRIQPKVSE